MQATEHTFPLPEVELHKLEEVEHQIEEPAGANTSSVTEFLQANKWSILAFGVLGGAIGWALSTRHS
ncbi:MAG: hypothetical protein JWM68_1503 [Verrucomicrobiales bacterium]|nr:hypothetical protein [Verrucomicrobiales bacterium]